MILYPAIDILDGKAVRLVQGRVEDATTYHDDPRPPGGEDLVEEVDVPERRGADDHALGAGPQRVAHGVDGSQPAAVLHGHAGALDDPAQVLDRARLAVLGAVEVDHVQVARAGVDPALRGVPSRAPSRSTTCRRRAPAATHAAAAVNGSSS